ncbi:uncharacterized protein LOC110766272 [Prunus avium]|uniref:Uncharacterized protein LOC110766272 n=1 Tax=Prunus avium TaxID=42229 RepID=A0A6P5TDV9_PRUAV|nr:uncharacterized protein LOC110766272 [Prunus avium]XP_021825255.1 uncharacterized protein LOC110766272 [Prunus avium]
MAALCARMTDIVNNTGVVVEIREVEQGDDDGKGKLVAKLQKGDRTVIRGMKFLDRMAYLGPRSIHVTAILATGTTKFILKAQDFATYGRLVFRLDKQVLAVDLEEMSGIRRMRPVRFLASVWANHRNGRRGS